MEHPTSVTVTVGEWATFKCSVNCFENVSLKWRIATPTMKEVNEQYYKYKRLQRMWSGKGTTIQHESIISESTDCPVATLRILANTQMNGAVIQCGAIATRKSVGSSYSRFAVLQVQPFPERIGNEAGSGTAATSITP